jgi:Flp pilus assembly protein TadD
MKIGLKVILFFGAGIFFASCSQKTQPVKEQLTYEDSLALGEQYVESGVNKQLEKDYRGSIGEWEKALNYIPGDAEIYNFIGVSYHRLDDYDNAIENFKEAVALRPNYVEAINNLGYMYFLKGDFEAAKQQFERAVAIDPTYQQAIDNLRATNDFLAGKLRIKSFMLFQKAAKSDSLEEELLRYKEVLQTDSNYAEAHNNIAVTFFYLDKFDSTLYHLKKALELDPKYSEALNNLGFVYDQLDNYKLAEKYYLAALKVRPGNITALKNLGDFYFRKGPMEAAEKVYKEVLRLDKNDSLANERMDAIKKLLNGDVNEK